MSDDHHSSGRSHSAAQDGPLDAQRAPVTPSLETVLRLLADGERQAVCLAMVDDDREVLTVEDIVDLVRSYGVDADRDRLRVDLHHRHLPKLAAAGIVDYDARSNTVRYWGQPTVEKWAEHFRAVEERHRQE